MKFRLEFDIKKLPVPIHHQHKLLLIGSCFTENIGAKLSNYKFPILQNPSGILFNPVSVAESLIDYMDNRQFTERDLFQLSEGWHSWKHHSRFSGLSANEALEKINTAGSTAHTFIKEADFLFITLGSSWVYTFTQNAINSQVGAVAANNHKAPANWFTRRLMTPEEINAGLDNLIYRLFLFNRKVKVIFTISPVRHLRDGVVENNRSKAGLIQAVHHLVDKFDRLYYFPAYELVIDDLRDYRFYAEDLVHPNYFATNYVWDKMVDACMDERTKLLMKEIDSINLAFKHKAFNPTSLQHKKFLQNAYEQTSRLSAQLPHLNFENELNYFKVGLG